MLVGCDEGSTRKTTLFGTVDQLVDQQTFNLTVAGSSPAGPTKILAYISLIYRGYRAHEKENSTPAAHLVSNRTLMKAELVSSGVIVSDRS